MWGMCVGVGCVWVFVGVWGVWGGSMYVGVWGCVGDVCVCVCVHPSVEASPWFTSRPGLKCTSFAFCTCCMQCLYKS